MRRHDNDMPGDLADEDAWSLPGGAGTYDPDNDVDATVDEITNEGALHGDAGRGFIRLDQHGDDVTDRAAAKSSDASVDDRDLQPDEGERGERAA